MWYDVQRIIEDADVRRVAQALGIKMQDGAKTNDETGDGTKIICPFHNDHNFGSASLVVKEWNGKVWKGMNCWACHTKYDLVKLVENRLNVSFVEAIEFIAKTNVGDDLSCYQTEGEKIPVVPGRPFLLSPSELSLIGLSGRGSHGFNGSVLNAYNYKPDDISTSEHVVFNKEPDDGTDEYQPFQVEYLVTQPVNYSIRNLYEEDYLTYAELVEEKARDTMEVKKMRYDSLQTAYSKSEVSERYNLKRDIQTIEDIIKKVRSCTKAFKKSAILEQQKRAKEEADYERIYFKYRAPV